MVNIPEPQPGLVIRYAYLWRDEQQRGREEGQKDRPCAVVLAVEQTEGRKRVVVAPITHTKPKANTGALPMPPQTAKRLGLDDAAQWIVTQEVNVFSWPGPDIRAVPGLMPATVAYGQLPYGLTSQLIEGVRRHVRERSAETVERDETEPPSPPGTRPLSGRGTSK